LILDWAAGGPTGFDISVLSMNGEYRRDPLLHTEHAEGYPELSPDGRWLAYATNESGQFEVLVTPFPDVGSQFIRVSTDGGQNPVWSPVGGELFYQQGLDRGVSNPEHPDPNDNAGAGDLNGCQKWMMSVGFETEPTFEPNVPEVLFEDTYHSPIGRHYDFDPVSQRFLMIKDTASRELVVIRNWVEELKERSFSAP
jgi:hypothetical protein